MSPRDEIHKMVEHLAEAKLPELRGFIEELTGADDETLGEETLAAIEEGLRDIEAGKTISVEEYRRTRGL
jgi:predicted transcriptional regulator